MSETTRVAPPRMGAWREGQRVFVRAWAPEHQRLELVRFDERGEQATATFPMAAERDGFFLATVEGGSPAEPFHYKMRIDNEGPFPDPWSRAQPFGVHGPSALVTDTFRWSDKGWRGISPEELVLYEVHVGTATKEGTFDALISRLDDIKALGATALELLPVASFPGRRNWGYDGVYLFAPAAPYGGPEGLKRLINAAHEAGLGVIIDAVYNHFGPDGNYLRAYSPSYFTSEFHTPWGDAIHYSGEGASVVRELALSNAEMWIREFHADGLRLDAVHEIKDTQTPHLLQELVSRARAAAPQRRVVVMAEDDRNERNLVTPIAQGGYGLDAVWADDGHHQLRRAFAGDSDGYFQDYTGSVEDIVTTLKEGWFFCGQYSKNLKRPRGTRGAELSPAAFIHCIQNHDQIGNRPLGNRLGEDVSDAAFRAMSATLLFSPYTPLLYAGQEWNSRTPFLYFTDHNLELGKLVTEGRRKEFAGFAKFQGEEVPDPQADETFKRSILDWSERDRLAHAGVLALYRELLQLRRSHPALLRPTREGFDVVALGANAFAMTRTAENGARMRLLVNVRDNTRLPLERGESMRLHTEERRFGGEGKTVIDGSEIALSGPMAVLLELPRK